MAQVLYIKNGERTQVALTVCCWCKDGTHATVINRKLELETPPGHGTERYLGASPSELVDRFLEHAARWEEEEGMVAVKLDEATVRRLLVQAESEAAEFHAERGGHRADDAEGVSEVWRVGVKSFCPRRLTFPVGV